MESKDEEVRKYIRLLLKEILSGTLMYTNDVPKRIEGIEAYPPYIVVRGRLHMGFGNENRKRAKHYFEKVRSKLMEHNEDKTRDVEEYLNKTASKDVYETTFLLPVYS